MTVLWGKDYVFSLFKEWSTGYVQTYYLKKYHNTLKLLLGYFNAAFERVIGLTCVEKSEYDSELRRRIIYVTL